jgi:two-component system response regulator YesN
MQMKILIADDEPLVRRGIISLLQGYADVELAGEVSNGLAAQEFIKSNPVDVVFVDIRMPKVDGIELLKWLMAYYPHIKSVVLSSYQDFDYVKKAFLFGAQDYYVTARQMELGEPDATTTSKESSPA